MTATWASEDLSVDCDDSLLTTNVLDASSTSECHSMIGRNSPASSSAAYVPENYICIEALELIATWEKCMKGVRVPCSGHVVVMPVQGGDNAEPPKRYMRAKKPLVVGLKTDYLG